MRNKILGQLPKFQGKMSSCSKIVNKNVPPPPSPT